MYKINDHIHKVDNKENHNGEQSPSHLRALTIINSYKTQKQLHNRLQTEKNQTYKFLKKCK